MSGSGDRIQIYFSIFLIIKRMRWPDPILKTYVTKKVKDPDDHRLVDQIDQKRMAAAPVNKGPGKRELIRLFSGIEPLSQSGSNKKNSKPGDKRK